MVRLNVASSENSNEHPYTHNWDSNVRENFNDYQNIIDRHTFHL